MRSFESNGKHVLHKDMGYDPVTDQYKSIYTIETVITVSVPHDCTPQERYRKEAEALSKYGIDIRDMQ